MGDRLVNLRTAVSQLESVFSSCKQVSSVYTTAPWGNNDQPSFLNMAVNIMVNADARRTLQEILSIEKAMGRERKEKWGQRLIDIDILFFGNSIIDETDLIIPHPEIQNRRFALVPMVEIAPDFSHPVLNKNISTLLSVCEDELAVNIHAQLNG